MGPYTNQKQEGDQKQKQKYLLFKIQKMKFFS